MDWITTLFSILEKGTAKILQLSAWRKAQRLKSLKQKIRRHFEYSQERLTGAYGSDRALLKNDGVLSESESELVQDALDELHKNGILAVFYGRYYLASYTPQYISPYGGR